MDIKKKYKKAASVIEPSKGFARRVLKEAKRQRARDTDNSKEKNCSDV
jgi:cell division septum initiation protein DivIVA